MGDTGEDEAKAFFKRSEELHINMSETLKEVSQLLRGFNQHQHGDRPVNDRSEGSNSNGRKVVADGQRVSVNTDHLEPNS